MEDRKSKGCWVVGIFGDQLFDLHISAIAGVGILLPSAPDAGRAVCAADVEITGLLSEDQINAANIAEGDFPVAMGFFVFEKVLELRMRQAELQEIPKRLKFPPWRQDFNDLLVLESLMPRSRTATAP